MNPGIANAGMVTGAVWSDINGDGKKELIITGEWMNTRIFSFNNNKAQELTNTNLTGLNGWWQTITATDINGDGIEDLVVGNIGENFYLRPDSMHPVKMWLNDFDHSGSVEQFLTKTINGKDMPVFLKRDVTDQFPALKKQNLKNSDYAPKSISELFGKELVDQAVVKQFNYCSSIIALNNGKGQFTIQKLPVQAQLSSVNAVCCTDINHDKRTDLVIGGNKFEFPPQFGRVDGSYGNVLINKGNGFECLPAVVSGLSLPGEVKDIKEITGMNKRYLIFVQNDEFPVLFQIKK
jgi:hypothetical protein